MRCLRFYTYKLFYFHPTSLKAFLDGSLPVCTNATPLAREVEWQRAMFCGIEHRPFGIVSAGGYPFYELSPRTNRPFANIVKVSRGGALEDTRISKILRISSFYLV